SSKLARFTTNFPTSCASSKTGISQDQDPAAKAWGEAWEAWADLAADLCSCRRVPIRPPEISRTRDTGLAAGYNLGRSIPPEFPPDILPPAPPSTCQTRTIALSWGEVRPARPRRRWWPPRAYPRY